MKNLLDLIFCAFFTLVCWPSCNIKEKILLGSNKNIDLILDCHLEQKFKIICFEIHKKNKKAIVVQLKLSASSSSPKLALSESEGDVKGEKRVRREFWSPWQCQGGVSDSPGAPGGVPGVGLCCSYLVLLEQQEGKSPGVQNELGF